MKNKNKKVCIYIDGENFTIFLQKFIDSENIKNDHTNVNWINLSKTFLRQQENEKLYSVNYFSVLYKHGSKFQKNQHQYHKQLIESGVKIIYGQYKKKSKKFKECNKIHKYKEEKETDVNIALQIVLDAEDNLYERAIIVGADTDLVPAIKKVKERHSEKEIYIYTPPTKRRVNAIDFLKIANKVKRLSLNRVLNYLFKK